MQYGNSPSYSHLVLSMLPLFRLFRNLFFLSQFNRVLLTALGRIDSEDQEDVETSKFMVQENENPVTRLKNALDLYYINL